MGIFIAVAAMAGFLAGAFITAAFGALAVVLMVRDAKKRRHGWWVFGTITVPVLACLVLLIYSLPNALNVPYSYDLTKLFLYCVGYGGSLGVAAAVASVVTLVIPRPKRSAVPPPIPR
jgi:hypothetical protein